jgi:hypothetical protein
MEIRKLELGPGIRLTAVSSDKFNPPDSPSQC